MHFSGFLILYHQYHELNGVQLSNHRLHRTVVDRVSDASDKRRIGGQQEVYPKNKKRNIQCFIKVYICPL
ncbi:hypothetical protein CAEBREN_12933 [Caenorhabditis brenneri]|uniref:Uncharacterized protein n=1 Tax=Caenorhabditis brenneri TaxID=135651 RepID=G0M6K4_CAEBE|nr:hypothetical protein CAEBREN_12933 [Caenorhabditis brenneri]